MAGSETLCSFRGGVLPFLGYTVRAAGQGMVFWPRCPKQGIQFGLPLS